MTNDWHSRSALIWQRQKKSNERCELYWEITNVDVVCCNDNTEELCSLSYLQYLQYVATVTMKLRDIVLGILSNVNNDEAYAVFGRMSDENRVCTIPISVAIPEGPWLPITVAAVHALNKPFLFTTESAGSICTWISIALLPLDPSDGYERLHHMLSEVHPVIVVTASDFDCERIRQILSEIPTNREPCFVDSFIRCASSIHVCNVNTFFESDNFTDDRTRSSLLSSLCQACTESEDLQTIWDHIQNAFDGAKCDRYQLNKADCDVLRISHIVFTSGSTGKPKGCISSTAALLNYISSKNISHSITSDSVVLLASTISFDPCMSDILATFTIRGTVALAHRGDLLQNPGHVIKSLGISHVLCTATFWCGVPTTLNYPKLRVVALGGEPIPRSLVRMWKGDTKQHETVKLIATYGVTEACVYQTIGEVTWEESKTSVGQDVGLPFSGISVRICVESRQDRLIDVEADGFPGGIGEIVLLGVQLDKASSYFGKTSLSSQKFLCENGTTHYRTGDRGYFQLGTNRLYVVGRIEGEEGTVKINGIRVELGEIEASLVDESDDHAVVKGAIAVVVQDDTMSTPTELHAYVVVSESCLHDLNFRLDVPENGALCCDTPLLTLLRERCRRKARVIPSVFVIIPRIPMSSTGKRDRRQLPSLQHTLPITALLRTQEESISTPLRTYGKTGSIVVDEISKCLNLHKCQTDVLSTSTTFAMVGGDSLTATRVVRALFARHHNVADSRFIGGTSGTIEGPLSVRHLFISRNLGEYVDWLDSQGICGSIEERRSVEVSVTVAMSNDYGPSLDAMVLYEALLQSTSSRLTNIAMALLDVGADPNIQESEGRIGKVSDRNTRKRLFRSNPLHLACLQGEPRLVKKLLQKGAKYNIPNASSFFPLHLAAGGKFHGETMLNEDDRRLLCVQHLVLAGCPLQIRDGSKQTILHSAARGGFVKILTYAFKHWSHHVAMLSSVKKEQSLLDLRDNWGRTPVHWAVLHGQPETLQILLTNGCSANPPRQKDSHRRTSVVDESPIEICTRLHNSDPDAFRLIRVMLTEAADTLPVLPLPVVVHEPVNETSTG